MTTPAKTYEVVRFEFGMPPESILLTTDPQKAVERRDRGNAERTEEDVNLSLVRYRVFVKVDGRYSILKPETQNTEENPE